MILALDSTLSWTPGTSSQHPLHLMSSGLSLGTLRQHQGMGAEGPGPEQVCPWPDQCLGAGQASHPVLAIFESRVGCPAELQQLWVRMAPQRGPLA